MIINMFNIIRNIFAIIGLILVIIITIVLVTSPKCKKEEPVTEIAFDVYIPNRNDTLHRVIKTTRGEGHVLRRDRWSYVIESESGRTIWMENYPIKITSQKTLTNEEIQEATEDRDCQEIGERNSE